jgi:hypothetical protein
MLAMRNHPYLGIGLGLGEAGVGGISAGGGAAAPAPPQPLNPGLVPPADLGIKFWFRPEEMAGVADGTALGTWTKVAGTVSNATQATAAKKPVWKTNIQNGLAACLFDGNDDILALTSTGFTSEWTHYLVANLTNKSSNAINYIFGQTGEGFVLGGSNATYGYLGQIQSGTDYWLTGSGYEGWHVYTFQRQEIYLNGAQAGPYTKLGTVDRIDIDSIGGRPDAANLGMIGYIGELIISNQQHDPTTRDGIEAYLMAKWGL